MEAASDSQRAAAIRRSPMRSTTMPAAIGSQTRMESRCACILVLSSAASEKPAEQRRETDHHPEGVRVEVTILDENRAQPAEGARRLIRQRRTPEEEDPGRHEA